MKRLQMYQVFPSVPEPLKFLEELSRNMWWCWHIDAIELFRRINPKIWRQSGSNPILFSTLIQPERLEELATDGGYLAHMERVKKKFETETATPEPDNESMDAGVGTIAYFSMEFGIHESLPLFAGGLGVLAGDHLKAASDLSLPLGSRRNIRIMIFFTCLYGASRIIPETRYPLLWPGPRDRSMPLSGRCRSVACRSTCWTPIYRRIQPR
jgi:hypothetical protein